MYILLTFDKYLSLSEPFYFDQSKLITLYYYILKKDFLLLIFVEKSHQSINKKNIYITYILEGRRQSSSERENVKRISVTIFIYKQPI